HQDATKKPDVADWFYLPSWEREPLPKLPAQHPLFDQPLTWLIFNDRAGLGAELVKRLEAEGQQVVSVEMGKSFRQVGENRYQLAPQNREDYDALLQELAHLEKTPDRIVHLWSVTPERRIAAMPRWD